MIRKYKDLAKKHGEAHGVNPLLIEAIIIIESSEDTYATRYEPNWKWWLSPIKYAKLVHTTSKTERVHQATSWGLMQVMGTVARELGFLGSMPELCKPDMGILFGTIKISKLLKKHHIATLALSAYNAGSPNSKVGAKYADKVLKQLEELINL